MDISRWMKSLLLTGASLLVSTSAFACGYDGCGRRYYDSPYAYAAPPAFAVVTVYSAYPAPAYYAPYAYAPPAYAVAIPSAYAYAAPGVSPYPYGYAYGYGPGYGPGFGYAGIRGGWPYAAPRPYYGPRRGGYVRAAHWRRW